MAHKKKKPDCLVAGVLALLTAFSPVVSVIPTYAASDNEMSTSVTIDNDPSPDIDSGGGSDGSNGSDGSGTAGVVIDNSDPSGSGQSNTGQSDISIEGDQGDGIVSETIGDMTGTDGIQVEDSGDGIQVEKGQDGDGILIDPSSLSGNDVQVEQAARLQEQAAEQYRALEQRGKEADAGLKLLKETLRECEGLRDAYRRAADQLKDMKTEIPQEELTESLAQGLKKVFSGFSIKDGGTLWEHTEKSVMDSIHAAVKDVQGRMPGAVFEEERDSIRMGEESVAGAVRHLKARELPLDEETYRKWSGRHAEEGMRMGL